MVDEIDFWFKGNKLSCLKKVLFNFVLYLLLSVIIYQIGNVFFPEIIDVSNDYSKLFIWVLIILIIKKSYNDYKELLNFLDVNSLISYAKTQDRRETIRIIGNHFWTIAKKVEQSKFKLEILKSFTPIPIIIFVLSVLVEEEWKPAGWSNNFSMAFKLLGVLIDFKGIIIVSAMLLTAIYLIVFFETWKKYKIQLTSYYELKHEYEYEKLRQS